MQHFLGKQAALLQSRSSSLANDWNSFETSWDFLTLPILRHKAVTLRESQESADAECHDRFRQMKELEEENNRLFIEAYGLQRELSPEVPDDQITLYRPDREEDIKRLLSYAIGCMMGRYSLDKPGLIYAHSGNQASTPASTRPSRRRRRHHPAARNRLGHPGRRRQPHRGVHRRGWPKEHLEENLKFIADSLGPTKGEQPRDTIRRYLATGFYKHHLSMYKRRPIYWLFSSGKQRAFQCLVYLHRYHEGTLARMRTEYVIPLQGKIAARIEQLEGDKTKATQHQPPQEAPEGTGRSQEAAGRTARLRGEAEARRRPEDQPRPRRRREGELRQVRRPAGRSRRPSQAGRTTNERPEPNSTRPSTASSRRGAADRLLE